MSPVLVVDDHLDTCELLVRVITRAGYPSECVTDGATAVAHAVVTPPAMVFLDVMMPNMDGFAVLERLRADEATREVPVVMYSAMTDPDAAARAIGLGAKDFVVKGRIDGDGLRAIVARYVGPPQ